MFPTNLFVMIPLLLIPFPPADRDWRVMEEFTQVREWNYQSDPWADNYRCTEVQCPCGTPEQFVLVVRPGRGYLVDHVQVGHLDFNGNYRARMMNTWAAEKGTWRSFIGDFEGDIYQGQAFYIRVWCVRLPPPPDPVLNLLEMR